MKFSLWPHASNPPSEILAAAQAADQAGWYGVWVADHYMPNTTDGQPADGPTHEAWTLLPAIAVVTKNVRLGSLVSPTSVHHPALIANRVATLDHLSAGRVVLGLGAGWQVNEHAAYGIELEEPGARVTRFEEAIRIVRSLLTDERTTFSGKVFQITDAPCEPKPVQPLLPILVGTASPRMLRITARHAQEWNTWGTPEIAAEKRARLLRACEEVGRDPGTIHSSVNAQLVIGGTPQPGTWQKGPQKLAGSVEQLRDAFGQYIEAGFDEFIVPDSTLGATIEERLDSIARIKADFIDQLPS